MWPWTIDAVSQMYTSLHPLPQDYYLENYLEPAGIYAKLLSVFRFCSLIIHDRFNESICTDRIENA